MHPCGLVISLNNHCFCCVALFRVTSDSATRNNRNCSYLGFGTFCCPYSICCYLRLPILTYSHRYYRHYKDGFYVTSAFIKWLFLTIVCEFAVVDDLMLEYLNLFVVCRLSVSNCICSCSLCRLDWLPNAL